MLSHAEQCIFLAVAFDAMGVVTCRAVYFPMNGF